MSDEQHVAMPKLYGAPAYARPKAPVEESARPFDPDEMPLTAALTTEERALLEALPARAYAPGGGVHVASEGARGGGHGTNGETRSRAGGLRAIAGRLLGG